MMGAFFLDSQYHHGVKFKMPTRSHIVLIVEDNESIAELERRHLERDGFIVLTATDSATAIKLINGPQRPAIMILDYRLPDMTGVELLQKIKDMGISIPTVIVTAAGNEQVAVSAMKLGAMDYIVKDQETIKHLPQTCRDVLKRFNLEHENSRLIEQMHMLNMELIETNRRLDDISKRDELTGIFNRRYMMESLSYEAARSTRYGVLLSFALLDLDHFKRINDTYGHTTGDLVLRQFASIVNGRLRKTDIMGRYGGEEFGLVLTNTSIENALVIVEELRETVERHPFGYEHSPLKLTVSAGVAGFIGDMKKEELVELADKSLYQAKHLGRNRTVAYQKGERPEMG